MDDPVNRISNQKIAAAIAAGHLGSTVRKILTGVRPAAYLIHNILNDKLFHLGDA